MKMECITSSIFRGDVVKRGAVVEMTDEEASSPFAVANFRAVGGTGETPPASAPSKVAAVSAASSPKVVAGLTREQAIAKLRSAGAAVKGNISNSALAELYDNTFATVTEATRR